MGKVIIKTCVKKETSKGIFYTIELSDGRKGISSEDLTSKIGFELELEIKEGKPYEGVMQYYFNTPKENKNGGKFFAKDWTFNKRQLSLELAISSIKLTDQKVSTENILALSEKYYEYLNKK
jgi:hypothetical protein